MASSRPSSKLPSQPEPASSSKPRISVDNWAVLIALLAALLVRSGLVKVVPW